VAEELLRRNLERAFDPGPDFPSRLLLSKTMALVGSVGQERRRRGKFGISLTPATWRLVAAALVVLVIIGAVGVFLSTHGVVRSSIPAYPGPTRVAQPAPFHFEVCRTTCDVPSQPALQPQPPITAPCVIDGSNSCLVGPPFFASSTIGWVFTDLPSGRSILYRTDDGAQHWRPALSWSGAKGEIVKSSADGQEVLVAVGYDTSSATIFHSSDGGTRWDARGFPATTGLPWVGFVSVREGWIYSGFDLLHTIDGGATWTRTGRLDTDPQGGGNLLFMPAAFGVFTSTGTTYLTHDLGVTWLKLNLARPQGLRSSAEFFNLETTFFSTHDGVLADYNCSVSACTSANLNYVYATSDGGNHWSQPVQLPANVERVIFIDSTHWFGLAAFDPSVDHGPINRLMRTADGGRHWETLVTASAGGSLPGWDLFSPIDFTDPLHGWATTTGSNGPGVSSLRVTRDGGATWTDRSLPAVPGA